MELRVFRERDEHGFEYVIAYGEVGSSRYVSLKWFISRDELLTHYSQTDIVVERSGGKCVLSYRDYCVKVKGGAKTETVHVEFKAELERPPEFIDVGFIEGLVKERGVSMAQNIIRNKCILLKP